MDDDLDHMDRHPSKINESWVNFFSRQNLTCICGVKMKPMTQGNLPRSFKAIRLVRSEIFTGRRLGTPWVAVHPKSITHGSTFFSRENLRCICRVKMISMTQGSLPRSFKAIRAKSHVHMLGQNEAYDTRKPPKKFQGNPTCARPNLRWTTTWIAVGRRPPKINHPWVNFFSRQNLKCIWGVKMIPMIEGSLPRGFKAIRVGRPAVDHVDRRPSKINESCVNFFLGKISRACDGSK
ncbi:uncharacterized protein G2W53_040017 [Senna tora]|uniref:Uncharacterized protein n=1 Tax=Senna tora TaxID=362788 RepID=A0A834SQT2_9FABA|nr:uncharacterized protein G2W53_040017 [Senna tora]